MPKVGAPMALVREALPARNGGLKIQQIGIMKENSLRWGPLPVQSLGRRWIPYSFRIREPWVAYGLTGALNGPISTITPGQHPPPLFRAQAPPLIRRLPMAQALFILPWRSRFTNLTG